MLQPVFDEGLKRSGHGGSGEADKDTERDRSRADGHSRRRGSLSWAHKAFVVHVRIKSIKYPCLLSMACYGVFKKPSIQLNWPTPHS